MGASRGPNLPSDILQRNSHPLLLKQLSHQSSSWRGIGIQLGFHPGELDTIEHKPANTTGGPTACLSAMLSNWLEWAPKDNRGSKQYATLGALKVAVDQAGFGRTAMELCVDK